MAADQLLRQAQFAADLAHLVLEQLAQRLDQLELQVFRQAADVVVRLDNGGRDRARSVIRSRPGRACPARGTSRRGRRPRGRSKTRMNVSPMRRRFSSGSSTPSSRFRNCSRASTTTRCAPRWRRNARSTPSARLSAAAVVDEDAGELVADRAVHERAATDESTPPDRPQMTCASPTCSRMRSMCLVDERAGRPRRLAAADAEREVRQDLVAARRVRHFGMELHAVDGRTGARNAATGRSSVDASTSNPGGGSSTWSP
jgi:hypothetical protein